MRAFVLTDASLERRAGQFVWLAIDTEKAENAPFKRKFPVEALPTFLVLDPKTESAAIRWVGSATVPQLHKLLDDGRLAVRGTGRGVEQILARADRAYGDGKYDDAARGYRDALAAAPKGWPRYGRTVESLLYALNRTDDHGGCALLARDAYPRLAGTPSGASVAAGGLSCALGMKKDDPGRAGLVATLRESTLQALQNTSVKIAADDISSVYETLADEREDAGDEKGKIQYLEDRSAFLDREAARAATAEQRAVFDSHRLGVALALGRPERAIPMLEQSERDFPNDYNPPARLAAAYKAMKRWDEALAASDRALAKAYGPRKLLILQNRAEILSGKGDAAGARATLAEALAMAESLPEGQKSERTIAALRKKLDTGAPKP
ncbi:MAG: tetratricopeptide repeat protein [Acidobacteriota bacterium]|nr:tetratricopeptide repeat protein [Acidobacteriota bacterium]